MIRIFCSYSHRDDDLKSLLEAHLSVLKLAGKVSVVWSDDDMTAGTEFDNRIRAEMTNAQIILLLLSSDYFKSHYCWHVEALFAFSRHDEGKARVIPVLLRQSKWQLVAELQKYVPIPRNYVPVSSWPNKDEALTQIVSEVDAAIDEESLPGEQLPITQQAAMVGDKHDTFYCEPICGAAVPVRVNGISELLPDIVLRFYGDPGYRRVVDITVSINTNITSRILGRPGMTEATLSLATGECTSHLPILSRGFRGVMRSVNRIVFLHVPLHELALLPFDNRSLRIGNLRANAAQLGISSSTLPTQIVMFVSITDTPVRNPQQSLATVTAKVSFRVQRLRDPLALDEIDSESIFEAPSSSPSNFVLPGNKLTTLLTFSGAVAEYEVSGERTRLLVRLGYVHPKVTLFVTTQAVSTTPHTIAATLTGADDSGFGAFERKEGQGFIDMSDRALRLFRLDTSHGMGYAVWEVEGILSHDVQEVNLGLVVIDARGPEERRSEALLIYGDLAPLSADCMASSRSPIPRFVQTSPGIPYSVSPKQPS